MQTFATKRIEEMSAREFESLDLRTIEGHAIRPRTHYHDDLLRIIKSEYEDWKYGLSDDERSSLSFWYGRGFRSINSKLRDSTEPEFKDSEILSLHIKNISNAITSAPSIPSVIQEVYRGENHQLITLAEAQRLCASKEVIKYESFLATSVLENEAFNFARDYHSSGYTESGLMIPIAALAKPIEQQIIYRYKFPEDRSKIKAAWIGNSTRELLFPIDTEARYQSVEEVIYLPQDIIDDFIFGKKDMTQALEYAEPRLQIVMEMIA